MKRLVILGLLIGLLVHSSQPIYGGSLLTEQENIDIGRVVEVIDGEVVKVHFYRRNFVMPSVETVKIIGIDTEASKEAFEYTTSRLLGKTVYFLYDEGFQITPDQMTQAHVFASYEQSIAEELLVLGFAKVDTTYEGCLNYADYLGAEYSARLYEIGRWETSLSRSTDRLNLNTAAPILLEETLGITAELATKIALYRNDNAFNTLHEIMAVDPSFNAEWVDKHSHLMSVVTNLNQTSNFELTSLLPTSSNVRDLIEALELFLKLNEVTQVEQIASVKEIGGYYPLIQPYLTVKTTNVLVEDQKIKVNLNTTSEQRFTIATGLAKVSYDQILALKKDGYVLSTLGELTRGTPIIGSSIGYIYFDHMNVFTDINNADEFELLSLFDSTKLKSTDIKVMVQKIIANRPYPRIESVKIVLGTSLYAQLRPYIYVHSVEQQQSYNKNTVHADDLTLLKAKYNNVYSRYTNVNTASKGMLMDLNRDMTEALVNDIMGYRLKHPFAKNNDLKEIFIDNNRLALFNRVEPYLTYN